jgi:hypothetical protein
MPTAPSETTVVALKGTLGPGSGVAVDPALTEQLALAADTEPVEVVLVLRQSGVDTDQHAKVDQECAAQNDELARVFGRITLEHRNLAGWEDDGGAVAAATERAPQ